VAPPGGFAKSDFRARTLAGSPFLPQRERVVISGMARYTRNGLLLGELSCWT